MRSIRKAIAAGALAPSFSHQTARAQLGEVSDFTNARKDMADFLVQNEDTLLQSKAVLDKVTNATLVLGVAGNSFAILGAGVALIEALSGKQSDTPIILTRLGQIDANVYNIADDVRKQFMLLDEKNE